MLVLMKLTCKPYLAFICFSSFCLSASLSSLVGAAGALEIYRESLISSVIFYCQILIIATSYESPPSWPTDNRKTKCLKPWLSHLDLKLISHEVAHLYSPLSCTCWCGPSPGQARSHHRCQSPGGCERTAQFLPSSPHRRASVLVAHTWFWAVVWRSIDRVITEFKGFLKKGYKLRSNVDLQDPVAIDDGSILAALVHQHVALLLLVEVHLCVKLDPNTVQWESSQM